MDNYGGGWSMPQDAALQAQQAYQAHAAGMAYPPSQSVPPPAGAAHSITPPPSSGGVVVDPATNMPIMAGGGVDGYNRNNRMARMEDKVLVTRTADEETEDGRIRNKEAMAKIRDAWIYKQIRARVDEFTEYKQVCMHVFMDVCVHERLYVVLYSRSNLLVALPSPRYLLGTVVLWNMECERQRKGREFG